jgi:hypothetical protein
MIKLTNLLKRITIVFTLVSLLVPTTLTLINVNAQEADENKIIRLEITKKDGSTEIKTTNLEELQTEKTPEIKAEAEMQKIESKFSPTDYQRIEEKGGVTYTKNKVAKINKTVLQKLGYTSQEIKDIELLVNNYNSNPIHSVQIIEKEEKSASNFNFSVLASATPEYCKNATHKEKVTKAELHFWGVRYFLSNCGVIEYQESYTNFAYTVGVLGTASSFSPCSLWCGAITALLVSNYSKISSDLGTKNDECDEQGAILDLHIPLSTWWVHHIC